MKNENSEFSDTYKEEIRQKLKAELELVNYFNELPPIDRYPAIDQSEVEMRRILFKEERKTFFEDLVNEFLKEESAREFSHTVESLQRQIDEENSLLPDAQPRLNIKGVGNWNHYLKEYYDAGVVPLRQPTYEFTYQALAGEDYLNFLKTRLMEITEPHEGNSKGKDIATSKQQLLILRCLENQGLMKLNDINESMAKQSKLLYRLFNRGEDNTNSNLKALKQIEDFNVNDLNEVKSFFNEAGMSLVVEMLTLEIEKKKKK